MELDLTRLSFSVFAFGASLTFQRSAGTFCLRRAFMTLTRTLKDCVIPPEVLGSQHFSLSNTFLMEFRSLV